MRDYITRVKTRILHVYTLETPFLLLLLFPFSREAPKTLGFTEQQYFKSLLLG